MEVKKFNYICDAGGILLGNDNFKAHFGNGVGDGGYTVYVDDNTGCSFDGEEDWHFVECVQGKFNVYYYDCGNGIEVLCECSGRYGIYNRDGDMYLKRWEE